MHKGTLAAVVVTFRIMGAALFPAATSFSEEPRLELEATEASVEPAMGWETGEPIEASVGRRVFRIKGYRIQEKTAANEWLNVESLPIPTVTLALQYRPQVRHFFGYDEKAYSFNDVVEGVDSVVSSATTYSDKIWFGFSFYEGEGFIGYGGVGFYDWKQKALGILRHPALLNCSSRSIHVSEKGIYVVTWESHEGSVGVCNGVVHINPKTLEAISYFPPGADSQSYDENKVPSEPISKLYFQSATELVGRLGLFRKTSAAGYYPSGTRKKILRQGLEHYMIAEAAREREVRNQAVETGKIILKQACEVTGAADRCEILGDAVGVFIRGGGPQDQSALRCTPAGPAYLWISASFGYPSTGREPENSDLRPPGTPQKHGSRPSYPEARSGSSWVWEDWKHWVHVRLGDFLVANQKCEPDPLGEWSGPVFKSATFHIQVKTLE